MSIAKKTTSLAAFLILAILSLGGFVSWGLYQMGHSIRGVIDIDTPLFESLSEIEIHKLEQNLSLREGVLEGMEHGASSSGFLAAISRFESLSTAVGKELLYIEEVLLEAAIHSDDPALNQVLSLVKKTEVVHHKFGELGKALFSDFRTKPAFSVEDMDIHLSGLLSLDKQMSQMLDESHREIKEKLHKSGKDLARMEETLLAIQLVLATVFLFLCAVVFYGVYRIMQQLGGDPSELASMAKRIAEGELREDSLSLDDNNSVMASMVIMQNRLAEVISEVKRVSKMVHSGAQELSQSSLGLSDRTESQAATLEMTAASTEQIASTVQSNVENTASARKLTERTGLRAAKGGDTANDAVKAMEGISDASEKVSAIVGVIDEIAFQTNLLALNAAVEAARAGEQGRGFAVVATEVRQLAGRSASAAKEIKELIEENVNRVQEGSALVINSGNELSSVVESFEALNNLIAQIAISSEGQSSDVNQINQSLMQIDTSTQQNSALVEESSAISQNLAELAEQLDQKISFFQVSQAA